MNDLLNKLLPMILSLALSQFIYIKIDKKYEVTNKVSSKLHIKHEWKASFCVCCTFICILSIGVLGIYVIDIPEILYSILNGILIGTCVSITNKRSSNKIR